MLSKQFGTDRVCLGVESRFDVLDKHHFVIKTFL